MKNNKVKIDVEELVDALGMALGDAANVQLPDPELLSFYNNLANREIWLDEDINISTIEISKLIMHFNRIDEANNIPVEERKPIKLFIYSYGGEVAACFNLIDTIELSKTPVYTYNMGLAMSAAFVILVSGHKRYATRRSTALIHSGSGGTQGTYEQNEAQMKDYKHAVQVMREYIMAKTKIDQKTFNKNKNTEWYMYAEDQLNNGVVDGILNSLAEI